ncbi:TTLL2 [Mytilus coruscus]|uniref:TTLL2 n=1 Tax=Mytilus coruscus TaxID=42192 RepID=A0A6J8DR15_MYTCO|nr:TTLL2 [Mytilus coruscus]
MTDRSKALVFRLNDHGQGPEIIRQMFLERGWVEFDEVQQEDEDWNIWWRTSRFRNCDYDFLQSWQRLNHYPKSVGITKKDCLARNLKRMKGVHGTGVYNFSPIAFNLPNDYTRYVAEYGRLKQQQNDGKSLLWICKPADMSRGRGIFLFRDISELQYDCNAVVQRYIAKPMLIGGYKFDLRIYVAVPSFHPLTVYIYEEGIVRFSTEKYDLNTLNNVFAHLTNTSINKHSPSYTTDKDPSLSADCQVDMIVKKPLLHDIIQLMNFKESDISRGGEKLKRQSTRIKGNETIDRYASSSRLSHHSSIQRGSSFHKNISSLSKQSTVGERELASYIEQDSDDIKIKVKGDECLGLPLVNTKEDSRPNSGSSGISSSHSDLRQGNEEVHKPIKNSIKRSKSADTRLNYDETVGSREKVKFYIGQKRIDDNNNVSKSTSVNNIRVPRSAVTRESSSRYPRIDRQTTSSSFAKSDGLISHRYEKGSIKSSATSDSAISSFSGSSENSDLISLPVETKATPRLLSQRQNVVPAVDVSASNSNMSVTESSQTMKIKSLRPNGNSSTFRKISALGVSNTPSQLNSNRSRSRMQTNISNSSVSNLPNVGYKKLQASTPVPKTTITPRHHGSIPRNISRNPPVSKYYVNNNGRNSSQANINLTRSQLFVSNSPTQSQTIRSSLQSNSRDLGQRNTNNSRLSIRRDSHNSKHPIRGRLKGPAPIVGDFFLGFPFSEISLKAANTTLDAHVVVKETQRLLKEALVKNGKGDFGDQSNLKKRIVDKGIVS